MLRHPSELQYLSPLIIPKGCSGLYEIDVRLHPEGKPITVLSVRTALFTGQRPISVTYDVPIMITRLLENGHVWMTDVPEEQVTCHKELSQCSGKVLVGGLGLGYFTQKLRKKEDVTKVVTVEISRNVKNLVWQHLKLDGRFTIVITDIHNYLKKTADKFDWVYLDIWRPTGETAWIDTVLPLKRLVQQTVCKDMGRILSWQEPVMLGQFRTNLLTKVSTDFQEIMAMSSQQINKLLRSKWHRPYRQFWSYVRTQKLTQKQTLELIDPFIEWMRNGMRNKFKK